MPNAELLRKQTKRGDLQGNVDNRRGELRVCVNCQRSPDLLKMRFSLEPPITGGGGVPIFFRSRRRIRKSTRSGSEAS